MEDEEVRKSQKRIYHQGMEIDHNPMIHQQAKAEVNQKKRHISGTSFNHFILKKISTSKCKAF
jgi:hypothetical protein